MRPSAMMLSGGTSPWALMAARKSSTGKLIAPPRRRLQHKTAWRHDLRPVLAVGVPTVAADHAAASAAAPVAVRTGADMAGGTHPPNSVEDVDDRAHGRTAESMSSHPSRSSFR